MHCLASCSLARQCIGDSATEITITDALPSQTTAGKAFVQAITLAGSDSIPVSMTTWAAFDKMYFTNGVDTPQQFDGSTISDVAGLGGSTFTCRVIQVFNNFLLLMNSTEDGTVVPQRVRWSEPGDPTSWNWSVNFNDLYSRDDRIIAAEQLGPYNIIYKERSIVRMEYIGHLDKTWDFLPTIFRIGALSENSVVNLDDRHFVVWEDNIYDYRGGFSIQPLGNKIRDLIFAHDGRLNPAQRGKVFAVLVREVGEIWIFYPTGSDTDPMSMVRFNRDANAFFTREFSIAFLGFGFFTSQSSITWNDLVGDWDAQLFPWVSSALSGSAPTVHLCSPDANQVFEYDYVTVDDNGTAIDYVVETKDFYVPNRELRFNRFDFMLKGTSITIEYSLDEGDSYAFLGTVSPGGMYMRTRLFKQFLGRYIRFRFSGSGNFGLEWMGFQWKQETLTE